LYALCHTGALPDVCRRFVLSQILKLCLELMKTVL
jgi:hypothetical protein